MASPFTLGKGTNMASVVLVYLILLFWSSSAKLVPEEVAALKAIATKLGKSNWDFSRDPCSGGGNWIVPSTVRSFASNITCNCSFRNGTICHVTDILLKAQNFTSSVPEEFASFGYLQTLDLSRNILTGGIPYQWANMKNLSFLSFMGNRLHGPFPIVLTRITSLTYLSLEGNQFSGSVPPEIGLLVNLSTLHLSSNFFTGKLPEDLSNLTSLKDLRLSDNNFTGRIPNSIGRLTQLGRLYIQGCSLNGPIPPSISSLVALNDLRISDLVGCGSTFPPLNETKNLRRLILRSCSITGEIPDYIVTFTRLNMLDLSFNNLTGVLPYLPRVESLYLTGNKFTGQIPPWILGGSTTASRDVSFNNFTLESPYPEACQQGKTNLVESHSLAPNSSSLHSSNLTCLEQGFPFPPVKLKKYRLYINCGGGNVANNNTTYEPDTEQGDTSKFYTSPGGCWGFSSTGEFMESDGAVGYTASYNGFSALNSTPMSLIYQTARFSPISLTYYGLCLGNGSYTVNLHFAEIVFTNDSTFSSLGRRIFDVYVQDQLVLKDFNIAVAAGGSGKPIIMPFIVNITSNALKIHLYWAGRGTTGIPIRGTYGPLISAIAVDPNFTPPPEPPPELQGPSPTRLRVEHQGLRPGQVAGITVGSICATLLILGVLRKTGYLGHKKPAEFSSLDLLTGMFTLRQIKAATNNFDVSLKIGEGGFGSVYKGLLSDGTVIAVKQLASRSRQGTREFVNEIGMISGLQHPNLVKLYGCCVEGNHLLLVYEYMENNCLARAIFGQDTVLKEKLDWDTRKKICLGLAKGLLYLHEESKLKIIHRDIKASNVLLDKDLNAKISDFGLAKLHEDDKSHISTRVAGTVGYMSPEYAMRGYLTPKADVYSFGIVLMEIVSGKSNTIYKADEESVYLLDWAYVLQESGSLLELVDPSLGCEYPPNEAMLLLNIALLCTNASPILRPVMSEVVNMLEGRKDIQEMVSDPGFSMAYYKAKFATHFWQRNDSCKEVSTESKSSEASALITEMEV